MLINCCCNIHLHDTEDFFFKQNVKKKHEIICVCRYFWLRFILLFVHWINRICNGVLFLRGHMHANLQELLLVFNVGIFAVRSVCLHCWCCLFLICLFTGSIGIAMQYLFFFMGKCMQTRRNYFFLFKVNIVVIRGVCFYFWLSADPWG